MNLIVATLSLAFLGSIHCIGMCGSIAALAGQSRASYQLGRLFAYITLLVLMKSFAVTASAIFEQQSFLITSKMLLIATMSFVIFQLMKGPVHLPKVPGTNRIQNWIVSQRESKFFSFYLGSFTLFLPCAWLYGVLMFAASLPSWSESLLATVAFWAGTAPALVIGQVGMKRLFQTKHQRWVQTLLIAICVGTVWIGWGRTTAPAKAAQTQLICH